MFQIAGVQKTTLLDYPSKVAAIVFTQGCNFRCGYCHNPDLLEYKNSAKNISPENFFEFLKKRQGKLDGVVITGGEPTLQPELYDFIIKIKELNFCVKLDTNGTNPEIINKLLLNNLLDYIAMDIKAPLDKYQQITSAKVNLDNIKKSINLILNSKIDYEFRTTVIKSQLSFDDFESIGKIIKGAKKYYLQKFVSSNIYNKNLTNSQTYTNDEFDKICKKLTNFVDYVSYR